MKVQITDVKTGEQIGAYGVDACSFWDATHCTIVTSTRPTLHQLGHEVRHCFQGNFHWGHVMNTYEAVVRIPSSGMYVKTRVQAQSSQDALWLLEGQYGAGNVVTLPTQIS